VKSPNMTDPLLKTRLHIPQARRVVVPRPSLFELIPRHDYSCFTLISAPVGFGKATLLGEWVRKNEIHASTSGIAGIVPLGSK
jgi:LuxR family maltose regulon positive regulatory protein